ncbi:hypothetical protein, partial [Faecalibaculum rodentium]|uniref:hypothetical protein n=1 Tax=Faecalibaculum rodentium TaxID=1702221 RepID=UPI003EB77597
KGIPVILYEEQQIGVDAFNQPINVYEKKVVSNVLVYPSTPEEIVTSTELSGKKLVPASAGVIPSTRQRLPA